MHQNPSTPIATFLQPEDVHLPLCATSKEELIRQLVDRIHARHGGFDVNTAVAAVMARDKVLPVTVERELAMAHARLPELEKPRLAVGVCPVGIPVPGAPDPVKIIVLTLAPSNDPNAYLRVTAAITKALLVPQAIARLASAKTPDQIMDILGVAHDNLPAFLAVHHIMNTSPLTLRDTDTLGAAIELFCARQIMDVPVVNAQNDVLGTIAVEDLLRLALPAHLRWMEDLSPILRFEPFAELVKRDSTLPVTNFMREDILSITTEKPAIQLAKLFLLDERRQVVVLEGRKLAGTIDLSNYIRKLFWD